MKLRSPTKINDYIKKIPLYNTLYGEKVKNFNFDQNLSSYPILERKHIIDGFPNNWMTPRLREAFQKGTIESTTTSGTTGHRIQIFRKKEWWREEYIRSYRYSPYLKNFDVDNGRKVILTTATCSNTTCHLNTPSYEERIISNTLYLNTSNDPNSWTQSDINRMISELNEFKSEYLDADPIYLALFLKKKADMGITTPIHLPNFITLSYEMVTSYARRFIKSLWDLPLLNFYGSTELGYSYIEQDGKLIRCPELSRAEFIPFCSKKNIYYLILSSIKNEFMPFLRFKTGDLVKINPQTSPSDLSDDTTIAFMCGREEDVIYNREGEPITPGEIDHILAELENNILIYQLQSNNSDILFRYISYDDGPLSEDYKINIVKKINETFNNKMNIQFKLERSIAPELSGKFLIIKQV